MRKFTVVVIVAVLLATTIVPPAYACGKVVPPCSGASRCKVLKNWGVTKQFGNIWASARKTWSLKDGWQWKVTSHWRTKDGVRHGREDYFAINARSVWIAEGNLKVHRSNKSGVGITW